MCRRIKKYRIALIISFVVILEILIFCLLWDKFNETARVSEQFSNMLLEYPIPPETVVIEKNQFNGKNWIGGGGSGGYWNVVAYVKMSTHLSKEEIIKFYENTSLFPYPKSNLLGVELELYFEDDFSLEQYTEGSYYRSKERHINYVSSYFDEFGRIIPIQDLDVNQPREITFIIQIHSGFSYFMQID